MSNVVKISYTRMSEFVLFFELSKNTKTVKTNMSRILTVIPQCCSLRETAEKIEKLVE